jgi:hypothetical protein
MWDLIVMLVTGNNQCKGLYFGAEKGGSVCFEILWRGMVVMMDLIFVRFAGSEPSSIFEEHFSRALMQLTGLTMLDLGSMRFLCCWDGGVVFISGQKGGECVFRDAIEGKYFDVGFDCDVCCRQRAGVDRRRTRFTSADAADLFKKA